MVIRILVSFLSLVFFSCSSPNRDKSKEKNEDKAVSQAEPPVQTAIEREMVLFEGGTFKMGSATGTQAEQPVHDVKINAFRIDKYPVTVADFRRFVEATHYQTDAERFGDSGVFDFTANGWTLMPGAYWEYPQGKNSSKAEDNHPVTHVSWNDATAYAAWAGVRLPSEAEWEYAATCGGKNGTKYSWGNELVENGKYMANVWQGDDMQSAQGADGFKLTSPVGSYGLTSCGLADMGGNVWNWCADTFKPYPGSTSDFQANPEIKVIRGGSFFFDQNGEHSFTCTFRASNSQETSLFNMGFRCASDGN